MQPTEVSGLYKVTEGIIVNKDNNALRNYKLRKIKNRQMTETINQLQSDMKDIKALLERLVK